MLYELQEDNVCNYSDLYSGLSVYASVTVSWAYGYRVRTPKAPLRIVAAVRKKQMCRTWLFEMQRPAFSGANMNI